MTVLRGWILIKSAARFAMILKSTLYQYKSR